METTGRVTPPAGAPAPPEPEAPAPPGLSFPLEGAEAERLYRDVEEQVNLPPGVIGEDAVAAVLCVLSQRVSGGEALHIVASLPRQVRPLFKSCPRHRWEKPDVFGREGFMERVSRHLKISAADAELVTRAVFTVVRRWLPPKEIRDVASQLPADLRELWNEPLFTPQVTLGPDGAAPPDAVAAKVLEEVRHADVLPPGVEAEDAVAAVLCPLCRRISRGEARDLLMALPPALRPLVERCALHRAEEPEPFHRDELLQRIAVRLGVPTAKAEEIARVVITAVERVITPKEIRDVASQLPQDLRGLWLDNPVAASHGV